MKHKESTIDFEIKWPTVEFYQKVYCLFFKNGILALQSKRTIELLDYETFREIYFSRSFTFS
jgi:hypothetical protein